MPTLLIKNASLLVTLDAQRREIPDAGIFIRDGWIEQVGPSEQLPKKADQILDLSGHIVLPGLINTHHHLYQTLTRAIPDAQDADLFQLLKSLYLICAGL
jgi:cytosine/adenosine deaminase-related metal-dependent hydrolase